MENFILLNSAPTKAVHHRKAIRRYFQQGEGRQKRAFTVISPCRCIAVLKYFAYLWPEHNFSYRN